jgi:SAM-dependent methyltransferase
MRANQRPSGMNTTYPTAELEHLAYVDYWGENAKRLNQQGVYRWMADQLAHAKPANMLDIGCGTGAGVAALRTAFGCRVLSIEHNEACINVAFENLRRLNGRTTKRFRFDYAMQPNGSHVVGIDQSAVASTSDPVCLVQGDLLLLDQDRPLHALVHRNAPYDAITVWLIGTYMFRSSCATLASLQMTTPADYRVEVQNRAYELASGVLRPGGVLHIVDRAAVDPTVPAAVLELHRDMAEGTGLNVSAVATRNYIEGGTRGVRMVFQHESQGEMTQPLRDLQLVSVIATKI